MFSSGIGSFPGGTGNSSATVTGAGSTWNNSGGLSVGTISVLNIEDGAVVSARSGGISGTATVTGPGSTWTNSGDLNVGSSSGGGTLNIENGGVVNSQFSTIASEWLEPTNTITVTGTGSTWNSPLGLVLGVHSSGILQIANGGAFSINSISTLGIALASVSDPFLDITGSATLAGTLDLSSADGFMPDPGDVFQIMTFGSRIGEFDTINSTTIDAGHEVIVNYNDFDITVTMALLGDVNFDGQVDGLDLEYIGAYGQVSGTDRSTGDLNGDGVTNGLDMNIVGEHWQDGVPAPSAIPEPGTLGLLALGITMMLRRRRGVVG